MNRRDFLKLSGLVLASAAVPSCVFIAPKKKGIGLFPVEVEEKDLINGLRDYIYAWYDYQMFEKPGKIIPASRNLEAVLKKHRLEGLFNPNELLEGKVPKHLPKYFANKKMVFRRGPQAIVSKFKVDFELRRLKNQDTRKQKLWGIEKEYTLKVFDATPILNTFDYRLDFQGKNLGRIGGSVRDGNVEVYLDGSEVILQYYFKVFQEKKQELEKEIDNPRLLDRYIGTRRVDPFFYQRLGEILHYQRLKDEFNGSDSLEEFVKRSLPFFQRDSEIHECQHLIDGLPGHCDLKLTKAHLEMRAILTELQHASPKRALANCLGLMAAAAVGEPIPEYYHTAGSSVVKLVCRVMARNRDKLPNIDYSGFDENRKLAHYLMEQFPKLQCNQLQGAAKAIFNKVYGGLSFGRYMRLQSEVGKGR